ncbi:MAG: pyrroloquinoline-quinone synthase PqqC [Candidatus Elarobacter sp.]
MVTATPDSPMIARLRALGEHYHDKHPFHRALVEGRLDAAHVRAWVANRYYYQKMIPVKDATILARLPSREHRRVWITRVIDHDGATGEEGGTAKWLGLARAVGLSDDDVVSEKLVSPGARFAVDAYVNFARQRTWLEAVASSLTELFGPVVMKHRIAAILEHYARIDRAGLAYFEDRIPLARRDADAALAWVVQEATTQEQQDACVAALSFKCDVLWGLLDATALQSGFFR